MCYGLIVQAACDSDCRFTFIQVVGPRVLPDREVYQLSNLAGLVNNLPSEYVVISHPTYTATENMIPLFFGEAVKEKENNIFNYFALQCHIRIELAFGLMTRKFGILQRLYSGQRLHQAKKLMIAIALVHNFVIDQRLARNHKTDNSSHNLSFHQPTCWERLSSLEFMS